MRSVKCVVRVFKQMSLSVCEHEAYEKLLIYILRSFRFSFYLKIRCEHKNECCNYGVCDAFRCAWIWEQFQRIGVGSEWALLIFGQFQFPNKLTRKFLLRL